MNAKDVKLIEKTRPFDGYFQIDRYVVRHRLFQGGWSEPVTREVFERGHAVTVLPYDPDLDQLVLIEQFRIGAFAALATPWFNDECSPWLIECVAGIIDEGETPEAVARRECLEEAGCEVTELVPIHHIFASPGGCTESVFVYCGRTDAAQASGVRGLVEEHENIRVLSIPAAEAFEWLDAGRISHSTTIIAMQWFREKHRDLRARWRSSTR